MKACIRLIAFLAGAVSIAARASDMELGYEYGRIALDQLYYSSFAASAPLRVNATFGLHRFVWFDTQGGMTAVVRGALNETSARTAKELEVQEAYRKGKTVSSYEYAWQQPEPIPTNGETWALVIGSSGSLFDAISSQVASPNKSPSVAGLEYQHNLWSLTSAPFSAAMGLGLKLHYFSHLSASDSTLSIPVSIGASTQIMPKVVSYVEYGRGLGGLFNAKKVGLYRNVEAGIHWQFAPEWKAVVTHRKTHDETAFVDNRPPNTQHDSTLTMFGIRWTP